MWMSREFRAAAAGAAIVSGYMLLVLASGMIDIAQFARLFSFYVTASYTLWLALGVIFCLFHLCRQAAQSGREPFLGKTLQDSVLRGWTSERFATLLWPPLLFGMLMASFNAFKQGILPSAGFGLDPAFAAMDRMLFLGIDPWRVTHAIFGSAQATALLDRAYHGWFVPMSLGVLICAWLPSSTYRLRTQYLLSYIFVWIGIGSLVAFALPSAGPCFYTQFVGVSPSYDALMGRLAEAQASTGSPLLALRNQAILLEAYGSDQLRVGGGISAMPSVHNALAALFALGAFRINRIAGWVLTAYAGVIWIGSIHLGWHYAVDGIVAVGLTLGIWRVCGHLAEALDRPFRLLDRQSALA